MVEPDDPLVVNVVGRHKASDSSEKTAALNVERLQSLIQDGHRVSGFQHVSTTLPFWVTTGGFSVRKEEHLSAFPSEI